MRERFKQKPIVAVLLPITLLLGVVILIATSIGPLLNAALDTPLVQVENEEGKQVENFKTKNESEKIQLIAKEDGILELKYDENFSVKVLNEKKEELSIPIYHKETLPSDKVSDTFKKMKEDTEDFYEGEDGKPEKKVACIRVMESEAKGSLYFEVEKDQKQWLEIQRHTSEKVDVELLKADDDKRIQQLIEFESLNKALVEPVSSGAPEKATTSQKQEETETQESKTQESTKTSESTEKSEETKKQETKNTTTSEQKKQETTETSSEKKNETTDSKAETKDESEKDTSKDSDKEETKLPELGTPESYKYVHAVETKKTDASLAKLLKAKYEPEDSLMKPKLLTTSKSTKETKGTKSDVPIIIRDVNLSVKTGTASFDSDNSPGHDKDADNDIVRSFDQVSYLVSFSIQNKELTKKYTNIKYQVIAKLDNAVEMVDGVPRNNAEIANGTYVGTGAQYSIGVMESVISDTGQVFVPIFMNVYGAPHGKKLKPTIELSIVEATNVETGEVEEFNKVYDTTDLPKLETPETTVSAEPSIKVELVKGEVKSSEAIGISLSHVNAYDIGAVTTLSPLSGRATGDYRGSTFPTGPITYTIKQKGKYQIGSNPEQEMARSDYISMKLFGLAPAYKDRTESTWAKRSESTVINLDQFELPLETPHAKTERVYTSQPTGDLSKVGVYDSGSFSTGFTFDNGTSIGTGTTITNSAYVGVVNPYTYNMNGNRAQAATDKSFSSLELIYGWDKQTTTNAGIAKGWSNYTTTLYIDSISYYDETAGRDVNKGNDTSVSYYTGLVPQSGSFAGGTTVMKFNRVDYGAGYLIESLNDAVEIGINTGNVQVARGSLIYLSGFPTTTDSRTRQINQLFMWDPSAFEYDLGYQPEVIEARAGTIVTDRQYVYGVAKNLSTSPPYTMRVQQLDTQMGSYTWYDTAEAASAAGQISAVLTKTKLSEDSFTTFGNRGIVPLVPVRVVGPTGSRSPAGNALVSLTATQFLNSNGGVLEQVPRNGTTETYSPTNFNSSGGVISRPNAHWNWTGESIYIKNFAVTTKTEVKNSLYQTNENIDIKVTGVYSGSSSETYDSALVTTLPKGIYYKEGSSVDDAGTPLPDPERVDNPNGTTTLRWTFSGISLSDSNERMVNFQANSDFTQLTFNDTGYTDNLTVNTVGEMWLSGNPDIKDTSREFVRMSFDTFIESLIQQIILSKEADKPFIEVGNNDPRPSGEDTSITYKIKMVNESASAIPDARLLEVLPFNGDNRGTNLSGDYSVKKILVNDSGAKISFSNNSVDPAATNPMDISGWTEYEPGVTPIETIKDAKSILVSRKDKDKPLEKGQTIELTVTIQPTGQKPGDVLVNNASMNSELNLPVNSQTVWTRVYGRDLTGYVWYDDNYDGLIDPAEDPVGNIPVKLYRTSQKDSSYVKQLVEESLTGEKFINASGDSLIKTGADGKYKFENLPEGEYIAEFMLEDIVVTRKVAIVTHQLRGDDPTKNSKADRTTFKTPETKEDGTPFYKHSELTNLPTLLTGTDKVSHITDVNAGLTRLSKIRLFKYDESSVVDDGDGILSAAEIEAATKPLAGAEFELFKGENSTDPADSLGKATTDEHGWLEFPGLPKGKYTLVETKAPEGYELLKEPITEIDIPEYNYITIVHVADKGQTELPFTGSTRAMRIILIAAACLLVIGMTGVFLHFRPIKVRGGK